MDTMTQREQIRLLQAMPIFGGVRDEALEFLMQLTREVDVPAGGYFYHEGDPGKSVFVLDCGKVVLMKRWQGEDYVLKSLDRGDSFGEVALIDLQPRNTSALAVETIRAMELSTDDLYKLYKRHLDQFALIYMNMARQVCRRLREADSRAFAADMRAN
ncbi:MAG: cyclic nucleotide-binding domain-containing protein [Gammaproteobacteria bacterium]|jgi:CRP-like cAMP-binding protein